MSSIYEKLKNREQVMMKFDDNPFTDGDLNPGWATPTYDNFFIRMADKPVLLNQSTVFPMTSVQHNLDDLDVDIELDAQRSTSTGKSLGLTENETNPRITGKQLNAQPLQGKTIITDNFLDENIEKEGFLTTYLNVLGEAMGPAFERWGIFADTTVPTVSGEGTGYAMANGLIAQAKAISTDNTNEANGLAKLVYKDNVGLGVLDAIERYIDQDGDLNNATCVLPPTMYSRLMREIAQDRETDLGDAVLQKGDMTTLLGIELVQDNILRETRNGYGTMKFTNGEYKGNGSNVDKMQYGFIGQPNNVVFGMMREMETKQQYDLEIWGYKVGMRVKGDCKIHYDQDTLVVPFTMNNTPSN